LSGRITIRLETKTKKQLEQLANENGKSISEQARRMIENNIDLAVVRQELADLRGLILGAEERSTDRLRQVSIKAREQIEGAEQRVNFKLGEVGKIILQRMQDNQKGNK